MFTTFGIAITAIILYFIFLHDSVKDHYEEKRKLDEKTSNVEKIAKIKAVSDEAKDIEKFVTDNASYLSRGTIEILVARIEELKADKIINGEVLKSRIDDLVEEELEQPTKRSKRK